MDKECQEPCCVEKRMVTIPLGFNCDPKVVEGIKFENYSKAVDNHATCARKFNTWMRANVTGEFYAKLLEEMSRSESKYPL